MIKYLGSKRRLLPEILAIVDELGPVESALDLFSGTARVGRALKARGCRVVANDHLTFAHVLARCHVAADAGPLADRAARLLRELDELPGVPGFVTETYCERSRFFQPQNGARIDAIRGRIAAMALEPDLEAIALTSLLEAADRVDSTTGVQMAYLKRWAPRASKRLELRMPELLPRPPAGRCEAWSLDARDAAGRVAVDVAYVDPPYNQHAYLGNYHIWETIVRWDAPETYGVACKRVDCRTRKSDFNSRTRAFDALAATLRAIRARHLVLSFSDEGAIPQDRLERLLASLGAVRVHASDHPRYVGARIGIHNPAGERVGQVGRLRNIERLYVVDLAGRPTGPERGDGHGDRSGASLSTKRP